RLATEAAELGIWDFDPVNNRLYWDDRMFDIFKVDRDTFTGDYEAWARTVLPEDLPKAEALVSQTLESGRTFHAVFASAGRAGKCAGWRDTALSRAMRRARPCG
ncbi:MAG: hypothetical protein D6781_00845, partial [Verrucomicrobia bacterium]